MHICTFFHNLSHFLTLCAVVPVYAFLHHRGVKFGWGRPALIPAFYNTYGQLFVKSKTLEGAIIFLHYIEIASVTFYNPSQYNSDR